MKKRKKRLIIYAFIDSQNLNLSVRNNLIGKNKKLYYRGWKLDFAKFRIYLQDKYKVKKAFLFIGYVSGNESLYKRLQQAGYVLIFKPTLEYRKGNRKVIKGNIDAELVLHAMIEYRCYHQAMIVAGDGDYHCLIEYLAQQKKLDHVVIPNKYSYSSLLRKFRKYFVYMNSLRKKLEETPKKRGSNLRTKP